MVRGAPEHLKDFVDALFLVLYFSIRDAVTQLDELNAGDLIGSRSSRGQVAAVPGQSQSDYNYHNGQYK